MVSNSANVAGMVSPRSASFFLFTYRPTFWPVCAMPQVGPWPKVLPSSVHWKIWFVSGPHHLSQPYALTYGSSGMISFAFTSAASIW